MESMKTCGRCGSYKLHVTINLNTEKRMAWCQTCGQQTGWYDTREEAIKEWNKLQEEFK